jgi:hypothetical protein
MMSVLVSMTIGHSEVRERSYTPSMILKVEPVPGLACASYVYS